MLSTDLPDLPVVIGVLNVTPDSFSDGGLYQDVGAAVRHGVLMREQGAGIVDVGGESTRPGAARVDADTEIERVVPVIGALAEHGVPTSVDTTRASVAAAALEAGATIVNDVSGGLADPGMHRVVADAGCPYVIMHWRGHSRDMQALAAYSDVVVEVRQELQQRVDEALAAGIAPERIIIDPGIGFAKTAEHNWALCKRLSELTSLGYRVLFGASRKSFLGSLLDGRPAPDRDVATAATSVLAAEAGVWGVRAHDVVATLDVLKVWRRWTVGRGGVASPRFRRYGADASGSWDRCTGRHSAFISLTGLTVRGYHGVLESERRQGQDFVLDVTLVLPLQHPASTDDVADTVHYGELADSLAAVVAGEPVDLIETLASRLLDVCLADARVREATVTVHKPHAPIAQTFHDVSVTMSRRR